MKKIMHLIKKHKKESLLVLFFVIVFVGFSITNAIKVSTERAETEQSQSSQKESMENAETIPVKEVSLTDKQKEIIEKYDEKTKQLIQTLSTHPWSSSDGKNTITFHDDYYEENVNGTSKKIPFAISTVQYANNGSDTEINTLVLETDTGTHLVTYTTTKATSETVKGTSAILSNTLFEQVDSAYTRIEELTTIQIQGLNEEAMTLLGDTEELSKSMSEWCAKRYPTMTNAIWNKTVNIQFDEKKATVTTAFFLGTNEQVEKNAPIVSLIYDRESKTYTFKM